MRDKRLLSIRLSPDGLSFWTGDSTASGSVLRIVPGRGIREESLLLRNKRDSAKISKILRGAGRGETLVLLDSLRSVLVPADLYQQGTEERYIGLNNYSVEPGEKIITSAECAGTISITIFPEEALVKLGEATGKILYLSCLQYALALAGRGENLKPGLKICIHLSERNAYFVLAGQEGILYCDALPYSSASDLLFYITRLTDMYDSKDSPVVIGGYNAKKTVKFLRRYFKNCICA